MPKPKGNRPTSMEPIAVTFLRVLMEHNTAGWIVKQLAELQEERHNTDCADILRSIVADRSGVPYVVSETSQSLSRPRPRSTEYFAAGFPDR